MCEKVLLNQMVIAVGYDLRNLETNNHLNLYSFVECTRSRFVSIRGFFIVQADFSLPAISDLA